MPSTDDGAAVRMNRALNCWPWVRSLTHSPEAVIHSPAATMAAWPTTVTRSRCPRALVRSTQEAVLRIVEGDALDQPGQDLPVRGLLAPAGGGFQDVPSAGAVRQFLHQVELPRTLRRGLVVPEARILIVHGGFFHLAPPALDPRKMRFHFLGREHASHPGNELRQRLRELTMFGCHLGEIEQLLADRIVEGRLDAVSEPYGLGGFALFEPDFVPAALGGLSHSGPPFPATSFYRTQLPVGGRLILARTAHGCPLP